MNTEFDKEFYNTTLTVREKDSAPEANVSSEDAYRIEKAVMDLLEFSGFRICDRGFRYVSYIISENIKNDDCTASIAQMYAKCAAKFSTTVKSVEAGIANAIKTAGKSSKLSNINTVFGCEYVICNSISNALLIDVVSVKFSLEFKYKKEINF